MIILDTHIFIWINENTDKIPLKLLTAIEHESDLGLAAISLWEIAMLVSKDRIILPCPLLPWLKQALSAGKIRVLPITPEIAVRSGELTIHGDPADRLIAATAIVHDCPLATLDGALLALPVLNTLSE